MWQAPTSLGGVSWHFPQVIWDVTKQISIVLQKSAYSAETNRTARWDRSPWNSTGKKELLIIKQETHMIWRFMGARSICLNVFCKDHQGRIWFRGSVIVWQGKSDVQDTIPVQWMLSFLIRIRNFHSYLTYVIFYTENDIFCVVF